MQIERGQVWVEKVIPMDGGEPWDRLHFVVNVQEHWLAQCKRTLVSSVTKDDGTIQTHPEDFKEFVYTGWSVDVTAPCIEQRSLEELEAIASGTYSPVDQETLDTLYETIRGQLASLDAVRKVGGFKRYRLMQESIKELVSVFCAAGGDPGLAKKLQAECWIKCR